MDILQGGAVANKSGKDLENEIAELLHDQGFTELDPTQKKQMLDNGGPMPHLTAPWFAQQVRLFRNLYNAKMVTDFYCWHPDVSKGFVIEVKWQSSAGSVDEKYVFTVLSLKKLQTHSILVLEGGGCRTDAVKWIRGQEKTTGTRTFRLMTYLDLKKFLRGLKVLRTPKG